MMDLEEKIREHLIDGRLPCPSAFMIAGRTGITPAEVRRVADRLGIRISRCQLGLFGFEEFGTRGLVHPLERIPPRIEEKLKAGLVDGSLPCITGEDSQVSCRMRCADRLDQDRSLPARLLLITARLEPAVSPGGQARRLARSPDPRRAPPPSGM